MHKLFCTYLIFTSIFYSCNKKNLLDVEEIEKNIPHGTGIDSEINRTKIDFLIDKLNNPDNNYVLVASHRGGIYWNNAPENTIKSFERTLGTGTDIIEIDIRKTSDGKLIVMHDSDLERTTNGTGKISHRTLSYIKSLKILNRDGQITDNLVPTLEEVMRFAKGKTLVMIDKANDSFEEVKNILIKTKTMDHAVFVEPYQKNEAQKKLTPYLFEKSHYIPRVKETVDNVARYVTPFLKDGSASAFEIRFSTENSHTLNLIQEFKKQNISVWITTLSKEMCAGHDDTLALTKPEEAWGWCVRKGANILLTDYPEKMVKFLETKKLH
ncbi:glycerophosphodiester phosphodiesterase family protein [Polaribacter batillariae]|uniref:Glycerophosphodiester phosphodiesterase family protein n=1 Tax=Polaribacter batillariae TaxID=2808900 RepID=A0ABX7SWF0_9FLAO|nr:glycerophosphodiester phosphodiesterase family protein [Polaribacter batillariae]QTD38585.1 glycerophosphodiester phosphodiesterase family protein [Polaribacter batillariae]